MVIFLNMDGTAEKIEPQHIYQGSNNVTDVTVVAPYAATTAMEIGFILPNGLYWTNEKGKRYMPMFSVEHNTVAGVNAWTYSLTASVTELVGKLQIAINAKTPEGNTTSYLCTAFVEESVLPDVTDPPPDTDVYALLQLYIARLDGRTKNVPNLVASIQKVAPNAFTFTNNSGVESAPIVIEDGETAPIPVNAASAIKIPADAWQPVYAGDGTTVTGYTYTVTAGLHGQMRDGATARDLWVSFDEAEEATFKGAYEDYTVDAAGDITVSVSQPIAMTVRVWNGKGLVDTTARDMIRTETERAEAAETQLQEQIDDIVQSGVDLTAREEIAAETERAKAAEAELGEKIEADTSALRQDIAEIESYIPSTTSPENPLANEAFVNSSINNMAAFYITYTAIGDKAFPTRADLLNATTFYSGGKARVPTQNDYAIVLADESQQKGVDGNYPTTRYSYQGGTYPSGQWDFQYVVNNTSLTQAQVDAINSGITGALVEQITTNKNDITTKASKDVATQSSNGLMSAADKTKLDGLGTGNVTGVKGNSESAYRTGNVNLTPANIGAVDKAGDTMTGNLHIDRPQGAYASVVLKTSDGETGGSSYFERSPSGSFYAVHNGEQIFFPSYGGKLIEFHGRNNDFQWTADNPSGIYVNAFTTYDKAFVAGDGGDKFMVYWDYGNGAWIKVSNGGNLALNAKFMDVEGYLYDAGQRVYSPNNKPTISSVVAYSSTSVTTGVKSLTNGTYADYNFLLFLVRMNGSDVVTRLIPTTTFMLQCYDESHRLRVADESKWVSFWYHRALLSKTEFYIYDMGGAST